MAIKLKKSKPGLVWLCFFLGVSIMAVLLITALSMLGHSGWAALKDPFVNYRDSIAFKERTAYYYDQLFVGAAYDPNTLLWAKQLLDREGDNIIYFVVNQAGNSSIKNIKINDLFPHSEKSKPTLPAAYNYFWYFDGQQLQVFNHGRAVDIKRLDSGYPTLIQHSKHFDLTSDQLANLTSDQLANAKILLAVKEPLEKNQYGRSGYYIDQQVLLIARWVYSFLLMTGLLLLVYTIIGRQQKRQFDRRLAHWSVRMWLEIKLVLSLLFLTLLAAVSFSIDTGWTNLLDQLLAITLFSAGFVMCCWWFYLMWIDLMVNRKKFFTRNSIAFLLKWYRQYERQYPWQKSMLKRTYNLVIIEGIFAFASASFLIIAILDSNWLSLLVAMIIAGIGIYLIYIYCKRFKETIGDLGQITDHLALIKNGDMQTKLELKPSADMYPVAQNINLIQDGIGVAVADKIKSERLKIDLITNVSHDLKTPLTSIISYVDLLQKEKDLPQHVQDYIKILAQKSDRLKYLIQDLFDLAKASSKNIALEIEKIDLALLIKQTLADMEEQISASGLVFKLNIPDEPVFIASDGKKLYRVWENLIANALKYSLTGTRVFIDLTVDEESVLATIKNTSNYEMNFTEEEILQRFVRGDQSRSTEGSGLGLSIAQSFTELCGGQFSIKLDGDLFKVAMRFKN